MANGFVIFDRVDRHFHKPGGGFTKELSEAKVFFKREKAESRRLDTFREDVLEVTFVPKLKEGISV